MKKWFIVALVGVAGLAAFAGTCVVTKVSLTQIGTRDVFAGQLDNNSGVNILQHNFVVAFLDSTGAVVDTRVVEGCLRSLQDGQSDFFSVKSGQDASKTSVGLARLSYDSALKVGDTATGDVSISNIISKRTGTTLKVSGTVKNNDDKLSDAAACIVVRDDQGNVVIAGRDASLGDLVSGASANFSISFTIPDDSGLIKSVDVWVDGLAGASTNTAGTPITPQASTGNAITVCGTATPSPTGSPFTATASPTGTPPTATATPPATSCP